MASIVAGTVRKGGGRKRPSLALDAESAALAAPAALAPAASAAAPAALAPAASAAEPAAAPAEPAAAPSRSLRSSRGAAAPSRSSSGSSRDSADAQRERLLALAQSQRSAGSESNNDGPPSPRHELLEEARAAAQTATRAASRGGRRVGFVAEPAAPVASAVAAAPVAAAPVASAVSAAPVASAVSAAPAAPPLRIGLRSSRAAAAAALAAAHAEEERRLQAEAEEEDERRRRGPGGPGGGEPEGEGGGPERGGEAPQTAIGFVASLLRRSVNFLKEDPYETDYRREYGQGTPIYDRITAIYQTVKRNPQDPVAIQQAETDLSTLQQQADCESDINVTLKPICKNVRASLYLFLHDTATSEDEILAAGRLEPGDDEVEQARDATRQARARAAAGQQRALEAARRANAANAVAAGIRQELDAALARRAQERALQLRAAGDRAAGDPALIAAGAALAERAARAGAPPPPPPPAASIGGSVASGGSPIGGGGGGSTASGGAASGSVASGGAGGGGAASGGGAATRSIGRGAGESYVVPQRLHDAALVPRAQRDEPGINVVNTLGPQPGAEELARRERVQRERANIERRRAQEEQTGAAGGP